MLFIGGKEIFHIFLLTGKKVFLRTTKSLSMFVFFQIIFFQFPHVQKYEHNPAKGLSHLKKML